MLYCVYEVKQDKILVINIASLLFIYNKQSAYKISSSTNMPVENLSGYNCPGCGITRAFHSLCILDFKSAYNYNPGIFIVAPLLLYIWLKELVKCLNT